MTAAVTQPTLYADALLKTLQRLRDRYKDMTVLQAMCFFMVAQRPGISQKELYEVLGASDSAASRILAVLSDFGDRKTAGLDLVRMTTNPTDRRVKLLYLTQKGHRVMEDIVSDIKGTVGNGHTAPA